MALPVGGDTTKGKAYSTDVYVKNLYVVTETELADATDYINLTEYSGKALGAIVAVQETAGTEPELAMAEGPAAADGWVMLGRIPVLTAGDLEDVDNVINTENKYIGKQVLDDNGTALTAMYATGILPASPWVLGDGTLTGAITPS